ncbi:MAG: energy-coupling factor transporter transmembrane component T [Bacillota bacterium]
MDSPVHRLDPRAKAIFFVCFAVTVVLTPPLDCPRFLGYLMLLAIILALSRVPAGYVLKRSLGVLPFVVGMALFLPFLRVESMVSIHGGLRAPLALYRFLGVESMTYAQGANWGTSLARELFRRPAQMGIGPMELGRNEVRLIVLWNILVKSWLSALAMAVLTCTTRFPRLLKGLARLGMPRVMVVLLSFAYRYIFVFTDEAMRMKRAKDSRDCGGSDHRTYKLKIVGSMIANLFLRAYERGERVYLAMKSRGFDGEVRTLEDLRFASRDVFFLAIMLGLLCAVRFVPLS